MSSRAFDTHLETIGTVLAGPWLPDYLRTAYESVSRDLLAAIEAARHALAADPLE